MQDDITRCRFTGTTTALEQHHVMNGNGFRKKAEHDGLWIMISHNIHRWIHDTGDGAKFAKHLKAQAQHEFEKTHSRVEWMTRYKKDYTRYYDDEDISEVYRNWDK